MLSAVMHLHILYGIHHEICINFVVCDGIFLADFLAGLNLLILLDISTC